MSGYSRPFSKGKEVHSHALTDRKGQIQNVKAARVYVFGDGDLAEDERGENVEFEVRSRRGPAANGGQSSGAAAEEEEVFFEKEIGEGETLQGLALKYACPVSELKRINNLIKDQDFFALRVLRVPMRRHGYLSEVVKLELNNSGGDSPSSTSKQKSAHSYRNGGAALLSESDIPSDATACSDVDFSDPETQMRVMRSVSIRDNFTKQGREAQRFLKKMDKDLSALRQSTVTERESLDEVVSMLTNTSIHPLTGGRRRKVDPGVVCGYRWWVIVLAAVSLAILVPTLFYIYMRVKSASDDGS